MKEKRTLFFQSIFWIVCAFISLISYIPPELSIVEVLIAVVVFIFIIYSAIRAVTTGNGTPTAILFGTTMTIIGQVMTNSHMHPLSRKIKAA